MCDLKAILEKIQEYKKPTKYLLDKYAYYTIEEYRERMNEACGGVQGYHASFSELQQYHLGNQIAFSMKCVLSILDEEGKELICKEGYGTNEIAISKDNGTFINIENLGDSLMADSFKSAADQFGIFGGKASKNAKLSGGDNPSSEKNTQPAVEEVRYYFKEKPTSQTDTRGNTSYKAVGYRMKDKKTCFEQGHTLLLYKNYYTKYIPKLNALLSMGEQGVVFTCKVQACGTDGVSFVVKELK